LRRVRIAGAVVEPASGIYNERMAIDLILGTAGHIDHGKTALIKALTGTNTDRLPEEKQRGITIELGFAELDVGPYRLGIVDVPGHERFIRNMLAGATGMDVALLVVAADDSVKPQTREHLDILRMLRLPGGVIALTKCDLADDEWVALVEEEIRELVADSFLAQAPIVRTSAQTGQGLDDLRRALEQAADKATASARQSLLSGPFRLPIDRCFTIAGHGTVVTGSVASGRVRVGDELAIEPGQRQVRVRGLQNHDRPVDEVCRGQRAALNLAGVHHQQILRGHELCSPGYLAPSRWLTVRLHLLDSAPRSLKHRARARCHVGTAELMCSVSLLEGDELQPGGTMLAQLILSREAVAAWDQGFILRTQSPLATIGGGRVLDPLPTRVRRSDSGRIGRLKELESSDPLRRSSAAVYLSGLKPWKPADLARTAGVVDGEPTVARLLERGDLRRLRISAVKQRIVQCDALAEAVTRIKSAVAQLHRRHPLQAEIDRAQVLSRCAYLGDEAVVAGVVEWMAAEGQVRLTRHGIALATHRPRLSANEQALLERIVDLYRDAAFQPPSVEEIQAQTKKNQAIVPQLIELARSQGRLVQYAAGCYLHADAERRMCETLTSRLIESESLTIREIRELLGTSRKYAVPLCEYLDRKGITRRDGDRRVLATTDSANR